MLPGSGQPCLSITERSWSRMGAALASWPILPEIPLENTLLWVPVDTLDSWHRCLQVRRWGGKWQQINGHFFKWRKQEFPGSIMLGWDKVHYESVIVASLWWGKLGGTMWCDPSGLIKTITARKFHASSREPLCPRSYCCEWQLLGEEPGSF